MSKLTQPVASGVDYLFRQMERQEQRNSDRKEQLSVALREVEFAEIERFFRQIKTQNIFLFTVGLNGKPESTILSKAVFSMNHLVKVYYSTSFDESQSGYLRITPDRLTQQILVERIHGMYAEPERLYQSVDQCHVIRWMVKWMMPRMDWHKTKLANLDLYRLFSDQREKQRQEQEALLDS
ncbi:MAG: hypothetical protein JXR44_01505 [Thiotrichales bacterium]|nr:hypothetical protein [Thiotrichales bacterium]